MMTSSLLKPACRPPPPRHQTFSRGCGRHRVSINKVGTAMCSLASKESKLAPQCGLAVKGIKVGIARRFGRQRY
eukprot:1138922-Karenia_brevis.AAC.1